MIVKQIWVQGLIHNMQLNALLCVVGTSYVVPQLVSNGVALSTAVALTAVSYSLAVDWFVDF